jgi:hypothetical protein
MLVGKLAGHPAKTKMSSTIFSITAEQLDQIAPCWTGTEWNVDIIEKAGGTPP